MTPKHKYIKSWCTKNSEKMFCKRAISLWKSIYKTLDKSFGITKNMENYTMLDSTSMNCLRGTFLGHSVTNISLPNPLVNDMFQIYTLYVLNIVLYLACKCCFPYKTGVLHLMFEILQGVFSEIHL